MSLFNALKFNCRYVFVSPPTKVSQNFLINRELFAALYSSGSCLFLTSSLLLYVCPLLAYKELLDEGEKAED